MHKTFKPAFFKRRWGRGAKPLSSSAEDGRSSGKEQPGLLYAAMSE